MSGKECSIGVESCWDRAGLETYITPDKKKTVGSKEMNLFPLGVSYFPSWARLRTFFMVCFGAAGVRVSVYTKWVGYSIYNISLILW